MTIVNVLKLLAALCHDNKLPFGVSSESPGCRLVIVLRVLGCSVLGRWVGVMRRQETAFNLFPVTSNVVLVPHPRRGKGLFIDIVFVRLDARWGEKVETLQNDIVLRCNARQSDRLIVVQALEFVHALFEFIQIILVETSRELLWGVDIFLVKPLSEKYHYIANGRWRLVEFPFVENTACYLEWRTGVRYLI